MLFYLLFYDVEKISLLAKDVIKISSAKRPSLPFAGRKIFPSQGDLLFLVLVSLAQPAFSFPIFRWMFMVRPSSDVPLPAPHTSLGMKVFPPVSLLEILGIADSRAFYGWVLSLDCFFSAWSCIGNESFPSGGSTW